MSGQFNGKISFFNSHFKPSTIYYISTKKEGPSCEVCSKQMKPSSGGKWICRGCGFILSCCP